VGGHGGFFFQPPRFVGGWVRGETPRGGGGRVGAKGLWGWLNIYKYNQIIELAGLKVGLKFGGWGWVVVGVGTLVFFFFFF